MIEFRQGDLFEDRAQALVNPVNCVGVMGKGLALQFKERFPDNFREYAEACYQGRLKPGQMLVFNNHRPDVHRYIINFPTKRHWKDQSRTRDICTGLRALAGEIEDRRIASVALPALGCGLGGLRWSDVKPIIREELSGLTGVEITVYEPTTGKRDNAARGQTRSRMRRNNG